MDATRHYQFAIIRYVPSLIREEFVNIGVVVSDITDMHPPRVWFTRDWTRLQSLDPIVDIEMLRGLEEGLMHQFRESTHTVSFMETLQGWSNNLQLSQLRARGAESMESLAKELMTMYVESSRQRILFAVAAGS